MPIARKYSGLTRRYQTASPSASFAGAGLPSTRMSHVVVAAKGNDRRERGGLDPGQRRGALEQSIVERDLLRGRRIGHARRVHRPDEHAIGIEAEVRVLQGHERAQQQPARDQQHERRRDFEHDRARAGCDNRRPPRRRGRPAAAPARRRHPTPAAPGPARRSRRCRRVRTAANRNTVPSSPMSPTLGALCGAAATSASMPQRATRTPSAPPMAESSRLSVSSCLMSRARPAPSARRTAISRDRAEARASSRLAMFAQAISSTNATAPSEDQQSLLDVADHLRVQRRDADAGAGVRFGMRRGELRREHVTPMPTVCSRRDAWLQPRDHPEHDQSSRRIGQVQATRPPHLGAVNHARTKRRRHHAHDLMRLAAERHRLLEDAGIGAEPPLPERVADHDDARSIGHVLARLERSAECRANAEHVEVFVGHLLAEEGFRLAAAGEAGLPPLNRASGRQRARSLSSPRHCRGYPTPGPDRPGRADPARP